MPDLKELTEQIDALETQAKALVAARDTAIDAETADKIQADLKSVVEAMKPLTEAHATAQQAIEYAGLKAQVKLLSEEREAIRSTNVDAGGRATHTDAAVDAAEEHYTGAKATHSLFHDMWAAKYGGDRGAVERLSDVKAMVEGTNSAGGQLVIPQYAEQLIQLRVAQTVSRLITPSIQVNSSSLTFISQTGGLTMGWTAELAEKPSADMTFSQYIVSVFTGAGLAWVSNQLLQDAGNGQLGGPSTGIDALILQELARRFAILEELAVINGSGTGQPLGILNTSGVNATSATTATVSGVLNSILTGITNVQTNYKGDPNAIVMHPRTWAYLVGGQESASPTTYLVGPPGGVGRRPSDPLPGSAIPGRVAGSIFGYDVYLSANIPTNLGGTTNQSAIIVGNFNEALFLDRQGFTVDTSEHVGFTTNQTVFRGEGRTGYTAGRYPTAFSVITGAGLASV